MNGWIETEDGFKFTVIDTNGYWRIIKIKHNSALYSSCSGCGYIHPCYKEDKLTQLKKIYAPEEEFRYCPMCGKDMEINKHF